jgi:hypothetical protein
MAGGSGKPVSPFWPASLQYQSKSRTMEGGSGHQSLPDFQGRERHPCQGDGELGAQLFVLKPNPKKGWKFLDLVIKSSKKS